ncbi:hypothetical protein ILUMI_19231 [Ignelater luminosus]|uniref:Uncharacterized protein n=1 Tax=Ignelater luminosus TaxID=2038154 RepID=A0A8K0CMS8_IGNLU|nr:hypothetical protein ILUMI_19231 [Ignelater luminosus]
MICFRNTVHPITLDMWCEARRKDQQEERNRIIETAAPVILENIRLRVYEVVTYSPFRHVSLLLRMIKKERRPIKTKNENQLSCTRTHGLLVYKKYGSRDAVDVLSAAGVCRLHQALVWQKGLIVFDVGSERSTKSAERLRRATKKATSNVTFNETMSVTMAKKLFRSNKQNRQRLISLLIPLLEAKHFNVKQALSTDLLVILPASAPLSPKIYMLKPGKSRLDNVVYSHLNFKFFQVSNDNILFLHAFSGCDTTSSFIGKRKLKLLKATLKNL